MTVEYGNWMMENSVTHPHNQQNKKKQQTLVLCKQCHWTSRYCKKHTKQKKNKTITGDNSANGRGNIFTKQKEETKLRRHKSRSDWAISPEAGDWNKKNKKITKKEEDYKWCHMNGGDETETNAHVIERKGKW